MERYVKSIRLFIDNILNGRRLDYKIKVVEKVLEELYKNDRLVIKIEDAERQAMANFIDNVRDRLIFDCNHKNEEET